MKYKTIWRLLDVGMAPVMLASAPVAAILSRARGRAPLSRGILDRFGAAVVQHHYYEPIVFPGDLRRDLSLPRQINGLELNEAGQLALVEQFRYRDELLAIPLTPPSETEFGYENNSFLSGDAEFLYDMIRHFKPRRLVEIGSGNSTLMAARAIRANRVDDAAYACDHVCIEPFEQPWLEQLDVSLIRTRVEECPDDIFTSLGADDILFIDSSHMIRPQGDVVHEYLYLLGLLAPGVIVHVHDIFTPRDYLAEWIIKERRLWNEQYLLEAFLCFNSEFEVLAAVNWLSHEHRDRLADAAPILARQPEREPGSFWFRRKPAARSVPLRDPIP